MATLPKMSAGFDPILFKPDAELIRLAKLAIEIGCDELILKPMKADELMRRWPRTRSARNGQRAGKGQIPMVPHLRGHRLVSHAHQLE